MWSRKWAAIAKTHWKKFLKDKKDMTTNNIYTQCTHYKFYNQNATIRILQLNKIKKFFMTTTDE